MKKEDQLDLIKDVFKIVLSNRFIHCEPLFKLLDLSNWSEEALDTLTEECKDYKNFHDDYIEAMGCDNLSSHYKQLTEEFHKTMTKIDEFTFPTINYYIQRLVSAKLLYTNNFSFKDSNYKKSIDREIGYASYKFIEFFGLDKTGISLLHVYITATDLEDIKKIRKLLSNYKERG